MNDTVKEYAYTLHGLGCANCARKIEDKIKALDYIQSATLSFATSRLTVKTDIADSDKLRNDFDKIIRSVEDGVVLRPADSSQEVGMSDSSHKGHAVECDCDSHSHHHAEECDEEHSHGGRQSIGERILLARIFAGAAILALMLIFHLPSPYEAALTMAGYLMIGWDILWKALKNTFRGNLFDENFLMSVATIGAIAIGEFHEAIGVMLFYQVGEYFQDKAVGRSRKSIAALMDIRPDHADLLADGQVTSVDPSVLVPGDMIIIKPGDKIPVDGVVVSGTSSLDTSALTGEALPRPVQAGSEVLSGCVNTGGLLTVRVTKSFGNSTVAKILDMVQNAAEKKASTENFITRFAKIYTPIVLGAAVLLAVIPPLVIQGAGFSDWLYRALTFLVISCPCALVISVPLGFFGGIGAASRKGILIKGGNYLEALGKADTVIYDKTGTLTTGIFEVRGIYPENGFTQEKLLEYAALAESFSTHPIALSVLRRYGAQPDTSIVSDYNNVPGMGVDAFIGGKRVLCGNASLLTGAGLKATDDDGAEGGVYVSVDGIYAGRLTVSDTLKPQSVDAVSSLKTLGIKRQVILSGDKRQTAERVASELGIDEVYSELLPDGKVAMFEKLSESSGVTVFVGDGINDAPVLARSDVGIAMGALGSDAAIEAADVVLMTDDPYAIAGAIKISRRTSMIVRQNIIFALGFKLAILLLGALGYASMWLAVFADVGVALLAVLNSMRTYSGIKK